MKNLLTLILLLIITIGCGKHNDLKPFTDYSQNSNTEHRLCKQSTDLYCSYLLDTDMYHREDGPAYPAPLDAGDGIYNNRSSNGIYFQNDRLHRKDGPVTVTYHECNSFGEMCKVKIEIYMQRGEYHREDGPSVIKYTSNDGYGNWQDAVLEEQYYYEGSSFSSANEYYQFIDSIE